MAKNTNEAQDRANANFKKKELQAREGAKAMADYEAASKALRDKTARLREMRLAKETADAAEALRSPPPAPVKKKKAAKRA